MELMRTDPLSIRRELESRLNIAALGGLETEAGLAQFIRHIAGIQCPTTARSLRRAIVEPLEAIGLTEQQDVVSNCIEALVTHGDLLELDDIDDDAALGRKTLLYTAPPQYVSLSPTRMLLLGVAPDNAPVLTSELAARVEHDGPLRFIHPTEQDTLPAQLLDLGWHEMAPDVWLQAPPACEAASLVDRMGHALANAPVVGDVPDLSILDHSTPSAFYKARWRVPEPGLSGYHIGRRSGAFGSAQWCYVALSNGEVHRLLHLPTGRTQDRGCDQAWRLQAAMDRLRGHPQQLRIRTLATDQVSLDIFSPIPKWLERRWTKVGRRENAQGCLASFHIDAAAADTEVAYAAERMWLEVAQA